VALLPSDPKQQKAIGGIIAVLALGYAFYTYWYTPKSDEVDQMEGRVQQLETRNRQAQIQAARGGTDLEERNALYERHVMKLEELIPQTEEVPELIETINRAARSTGVNVSGMTPEPQQPGEFYVKQGWGLQVIGEYHDVGRFMTSIASLPRIITPVDVEISTYNQPPGVGLDYESPILVNFRIELYVLPEQTEGPPPGAVGTGEDE